MYSPSFSYLMLAYSIFAPLPRLGNEFELCVGFPCFNHDTDGNGYPRAVQYIVTLSPSLTYIVLGEWDIISGGATCNK